MIEVRIRHDFDAVSIHLCDWPADDLGSLLQSVGCWGIVTPAGEYETRALTGQIRVDEVDEAYFELIISTEQDA